MPDPMEISADRLWQAAEACMSAAMDVAKATGTAAPWPPDLMGTSSQPECLCEFTRFEVEQASLFLRRMGFIQIKATKLKGGLD